MAARFVVGLALFALCHSSPVLKNEIRDGRFLSLAKGVASGYGGENRATANVHGNVAHATGTTNGAGLARDGLYYPGQGQAIANAQTYDSVDPAAVEVARAQGFYHPLPVAQPAVITYNQNLVPAEQLVYQPLSVAPASAESIANTNGAAEYSQSTANNNGAGLSESNAHTSGNSGVTTTQAKTFGGQNTAFSKANTGYGSASVSSKASGSGFGNGFASSKAQTNGLIGAAEPAPIPSEITVEPTVIAAKNQGFYNPAQYGSASSNANVHGYGSAASSAKTGPARRSISWRFGTAYNIPAGYGAIKSAAPVVYQPAPVVYQPAPVVYHAAPVPVSPYGAVNSAVNTRGSGSAQANANYNPGFSSNIRSTANSNVGGSANANSDVNNNGYSLYRSGAIGSGIAKTVANSEGASSADSTANLNQGVGIAKSTANSNGGYSHANADINNRNYGLYRSGVEGAQWGRTVADSRTSGFGSALSNAQSYPSGLKSADSSAKTNGWGSAIADSQSL